MRLLILGAGWVGDALRARHPDASFTKRTARDGALAFDLADERTWTNLPRADAVVWTFPAAPPDRALRLRRGHFPDANTIVLGSTSAYVTRVPDEEVDEDSPLDLAQARVAGEEALRRDGATVLALAGLWGPGRDPLNWLVEGRIRNGAKYVNLAHLDDVLAAIEAVLASPRPGERINVSDGEPRRWSEHVSRLKASGRLAPDFALPDSPPGTDSKRVTHRRLRALLGEAHRFTTFT